MPCFQHVPCAIPRSVFLERWLVFYPKEQLLVLYTSQLERDPEGTMRKVEKHLGIKVRMELLGAR